MISVLTAVAPAHAHLLERAHASLAAHARDLEWVVELDGPGFDVGLPRAPWIRVEAGGRSQGVSATRNRALLRARGACVMALDADDELPAGGLSPLVEALDRHPEAVYAIGETLDLFPDGQRIRRFARRPYTPGVLRPGALEEEWRTAKNLFLQPGGALYRRDAVLAAGGWPAIGGMEDQDLLLAISTAHPGVYVAEDVYLYRQHAGQTVRTVAFEAERERYRAWCHERLRAQRVLRGDDPAAIAALSTPLPTPEEIAAFVTPEWRSATDRLAAL